MKKYLSLILALVMALSLTTVAWGASGTISGSGTEADPYTVSSVEELKAFRDSVNAGETTYNAEGVYVALGADIDMAGEDWSVNIGDDCNATFDGIFDGKNHKISNLTSTETAQKSDGYICTGLFGAIYGSAEVRNLTIENITINTGSYTGNNVGAVVGFAYTATGSIENVKVTGNITINAADVDGVGAIVGYAYEGTLTVKDCVVDGNSGSSVTGQAFVGGVVGYAGGKTTLSNCTVQDVAIDATSCCAGGVAGILLTGGSVSNSTVKNVDLTAAHENWKNSAATVVGCTTGSITVSGSVYENVTTNDAAASAIVGSEYADQPTSPVSAVAARIGDTYYKTLAEAVAVGGTVELLSNVTLNEVVTVAAAKTVTLDLNGKTITANAGVLNKGNLTIKDSSNPSTGKIVGEIGSEGTLAIVGGTFTDDVSDYVADGTAAAKVNDSYIVGADNIKAAATTGATVTVLQGTVTLNNGTTLDSTDGAYTVPQPPVYYPIYTPVEDTRVDSAQTFDAGIALYVGVSIMGAVGTVALGKKRED